MSIIIFGFNNDDWDILILHYHKTTDFRDLLLLMVYVINMMTIKYWLQPTQNLFFSPKHSTLHRYLLPNSHRNMMKQSETYGTINEPEPLIAKPAITSCCNRKYVMLIVGVLAIFSIMAFHPRSTNSNLISYLFSYVHIL